MILKMKKYSGVYSYVCCERVDVFTDSIKVTSSGKTCWYGKVFYEHGYLDGEQLW